MMRFDVYYGVCFVGSFYASDENEACERCADRYGRHSIDYQAFFNGFDS